MQSNAPEQDVAALTVQALSKALGDRLVAVALFGSRARGQGGTQSDWDLLVVVRGLPESPLERLISLKRLLPPGCEAISRLLGPDIHAQSDYGDEAAWKTPWELFSEADAKQALALADEAVHLAREVVGGGGSG